MAMIDGYNGCCSGCSCKKEPTHYNSVDEFKSGDIIMYENNKRVEVIDYLYYVNNAHCRSMLCAKFAHSSSHNVLGWRVIGNVNCLDNLKCCCRCCNNK